ncbi:MAG: tetratricopeptide repeat protein [Pseudomonadota bacterium]
MRQNKIPRSMFPYIYVLSLVVISSCVTMGDSRKEDDVSTQISNLQAISASNAQSIEELKAENEKLKGEIEKLHHILGQQVTAQQSTTVQPATAQAAQAGAAVVDMAVAAASLPENMDVDEKYKTARKFHEEKKYDEAEKYYASIVGSKSTWYDERARFFLGSLYYEKENYKQSVVTLQDLIDQYPKSKNISTAIYIQAECFYQMKQHKEAEVFFKDLVSRFPNSKEAAKAKQRLSKI